MSRKQDLLKFILGLIFVLSLAALIKTTVFGGSAPEVEKPSVTPSPPQANKVEIVTGPEWQRIVSSATKGLVLNRDKMEKVSFYSTKTRNSRATRIECYIGLSDNEMPFLRIRATYFGEDWIFFDSVKAMVDDLVIYGRKFQRADVVRHNSGGSVWETADYVVGDNELGALIAIARGKSSTVRFSGNEWRRDHEVTKNERRDIQRVLEVYAQLSDQLARKAPKAPAAAISEPAPIVITAPSPATPQSSPAG